MSVTKVEGWQTSDGSVFKTEGEAKTYEVRMRLFHALDIACQDCERPFLQNQEEDLRIIREAKPGTPLDSLRLSIIAYLEHP